MRLSGRVGGVTLFVDDPDFKLYHASATDLLDLDVGRVDAIVTSPPYLDVRPDVAAMKYEQYMDWAEDWLSSLSAAIEETGSMMLNLGRVHRDGEEVRWHDDLLDRAAMSGWRLIDTLIWHKVNGGGGKGSVYLIDRHEYVYWLAKNVDCYKGFDEARVPYAEATVSRYQRRWKASGSAAKGIEGVASDGRELHPDGAKAGSVFTTSVGVEKGIEHPTPMGVDLAVHLVKLACPPGGVVLDPFLGSGTTALAARHLGRRTVGIETVERWCLDAADRLSQQTLIAVD